MKKITKIIIAIFFLLSGTLLSPFAQATTHIPFQLTDTPYLDFDPKLNDAGYTVWAGEDGNDFEIYLFDGTDIHQITDNETSDMYPQINASGHVVWEGHDGIDTKIYLYDGTDIVQLTDNSSSNREPQINNQGIVVWQGDDGSDTEIYLFNGVTTLQLTNNLTDDENPRLNDEGHVVWMAKDEFDSEEDEFEREIFLYDGTVIRQISDNQLDDKNPQINNNGSVVWRGHDGSDWEIFFHDGTSIVQITDNDYSDYDPQINDDNIIVWEGDSGSNSEIFIATPCPDIDNDGYCAAEPDCDDNDPAINPGAAEICGDEKDNDCNPGTSDACPVVSVEISVAPNTILAGQGIALTWNSSNATTVVIDQGLEEVWANGTYYLAPMATTVYTITATGPYGTSTASVEVTVTGRLQPTEIELTAADFNEPDHFGFTVDITRNFAIVGSRTADHIATDAGAAYIYKKEESGWVAESKILAGDGTAGDSFGYSVAINGDDAIIGAMYADYTWESSGAAYIFHYNGADWIEQTKISALASGTQYLGEAVAISNDYAACGGNGQVLIYKKEGDNWQEMTILADPLTRNYSYFGHKVSIYDNTIIVGSSDTVHIYRFNGLVWSEEARLAAPDNEVNSVSIYGDYAVFGNMYEDAPFYSSLGAVYVYHYNGDEWLQQAKLTPAAPSSSIGFGTSVDMSNNYLVIGAKGYGAESYWNTNGWSYVFKRSGSTWQEMGLFLASDGQSSDYFGTSIAMSGATIMVGARGTRNNGSSPGSVYMYELPDVIIDFTASPKITPTGESILTWSSTNADSCTIEPAIGTVPLAGSFAVTTDTTTTYTITCQNSAETSSADATVVVGYPSPVIITNASPEIITLGEAATLSWNTLHADSVIIDHGIGSMPAKGSTTIYPSESVDVYTITAIGPGEEVSTTATVMVLPTVSITATPDNIVIGDPVTLTWNTQFADSCTIEPDIGNVPCNGSTTVTPSEISSSNTYTITASGPAGTTTGDVDISVIFPPPTVHLTISKVQSLYYFLEWQTTNANICIITPGIGDVAVNGNTVIFAPTKNTVYTITASGPGGTVTASGPVFIGNDPAPLITIYSPQPNEGIDRPDTMVEGRVYHSNDLETGVMVNGVLALLDGDKFIANHVPLLDGQNTITAVATDIMGNTAEYSISVNADTTGEYIKLLTNKESSLAPLEFSLRIDGTFDIVNPLLSYSGPGLATVQASTEINEYNVSLTEPGLYLFRFETTDAQSNFYSDTTAIAVTDATALETLLKNKWFEMSGNLIAGEIQLALSYFVATNQPKYSEIFTSLGVSGINTIFSNITDIKLFSQYDKAANSGAVKSEIGGTYSYPVNFVQDENGIWRIMDF